MQAGRTAESAWLQHRGNHVMACRRAQHPPGTKAHPGCTLTPILPAPLAPAGNMCSVVIRPTGTSSTFINLAELELYSTAGARLPASTVVMALSSTRSSQEASLCNDGNLGTICHSESRAQADPSPTLRAYYPCGSGATELARVVVQNRQDCCQDRLTQFTLDFLNAARVADRPSYAFSVAQASYTVRNLAEGAARLLGATTAAACTAANGVAGTLCAALPVAAGGCGSTPTIVTAQQAASMHPVTSLVAYSHTGSSVLDALRVTFSNGQAQTLGSPAAVASGRQLASLTIPAGGKVAQLYVWTSLATGDVQGVYLQVVQGADVRVLDASGGRAREAASIKLAVPAADLGSGILLGLSAAMVAEPPDAKLTALGLTFLRAPLSAAVTVDMPTIDLEAVRSQTRSQLTASSQVSGTLTNTVSCPAYSTTITRSSSYGTQQDDVARLTQLLRGLAPATSSRNIALEANLRWATLLQPPNSSATTQLWNGRVADIANASGLLTPQSGVSQALTAAAAFTTLPNPTSTASCVYYHATVQLSVPYTAAVQLFFDAAGSSSWTVRFSGQYAAAAATEVRTAFIVSGVTVSSTSPVLPGERPEADGSACGCSVRARKILEVQLHDAYELCTCVADYRSAAHQRAG